MPHETHHTADAAISPAPQPDFDVQRDALARRLMAIGVETLTLHYHGSGDSGSLDYIEAVPHGVQLPDDLARDLEDFGDALMDDSGVNWYDGDGGGGTVCFDLKNRHFSAEVWFDTVVSECGYAADEPLFEADASPVSNPPAPDPPLSGGNGPDTGELASPAPVA